MRLRIIPHFAILAVSLTSALVWADPQETKVPPPTKITGDDLPDGFSYRGIVDSMSGLNREYPAMAQNIVMQRLGVDPRTATELLEYMDAVSREGRAARWQARRDVLCPRGGPPPVDAIYQKLRLASASRASVDTQMFLRMQNDFDPEVVEEMLEWVADNKQGAAIYHRDDENVNEAGGISKEEFSAHICEKLEREP